MIDFWPNATILSIFQNYYLFIVNEPRIQILHRCMIINHIVCFDFQCILYNLVEKIYLFAIFMLKTGIVFKNPISRYTFRYCCLNVSTHNIPQLLLYIVWKKVIWLYFVIISHASFQSQLVTKVIACFHVYFERSSNEKNIFIFRSSIFFSLLY